MEVFVASQRQAEFGTREAWAQVLYVDETSNRLARVVDGVVVLELNDETLGRVRQAVWHEDSVVRRD